MDSKPQGPLHGIRVIEIGTAVTAPHCCMLLAEMGAEVIKIEQPGGGDDSRQWGTLVGGESPYFAHYNRGKKSCAVNLKSREGQEVLKRLASRSDVLVENLRPSALEKLGLGEETIRKLAPRLVYCSVSGFGRVKSLRDLPAYDIIVQAMGGLMSVTGEADGEPLRVGVPIVDILTALFCAYGVASALLWRGRSGTGQKVEVSLLAAALQAVGQWIAIYGATGQVPRRAGNRYPLITPYESYRTKDGWLMVAAGTESQWKRLCECLGQEVLLSDPRFATNQERIKAQNREMLSVVLAGAFKLRTTSNWVATLRRAGVPAGPINTIDKLVEDRELFDAGLLVKSVHPRIGELPVTGLAANLSRAPAKVRGPAPVLGEHTKQVLSSLGYTAPQIARLVHRGAVEVAREVE